MPKASISELLAASPLMRPNDRDHQLSAARELHVFRDDDGLKGKVHKGARPAYARSGGLGAKLSKLVSERKGSGRRARLRGGKRRAKTAGKKSRTTIVPILNEARGVLIRRKEAHGADSPWVIISGRGGAYTPNALGELVNGVARTLEIDRHLHERLRDSRKVS